MICKLCGERSVSQLYVVNDYTIWQCTSCQFGQVLLDESLLDSFYDEDYFSGRKALFAQLRHQPIRPGIAFWLEHYLKKVKPEHDLNLAEIGPGPGSAVGRFLRERYPNVKYEAIEISNFAATCLSEEGFHVHTGKITDYTIRQQCRAKFDLVIGIEVIEHDPNPRSFASAVYDMLKPGGRCAFTTGNLNGVMARVKQSRWYYIDPPAHVSYYTPKAARILLDTSGFEDVSTWKIGFNYIELQMKYRIPGLLRLAHVFSLPTGMTITAVHPTS